MALPTRTAVCSRCGTAFAAAPTRTFLGFQRFICPSCQGETLYPLTSGYRVTYWVIMGLVGVFFLWSLSQGELPAPGILVILVAIALYHDFKIKRSVRETESRRQ